MRLVDLIRAHRKAIIQDWNDFARTMDPEGALSDVALRDHSSEIIDAILLDMETPQRASEQAAKSKGLAGPNAMDAVGKVHADLRIEAGFRIDQIIAEYRALRASVLRLWEREKPADEGIQADVTRFNESVDSAIAEAAARMTASMARYRDQSLAILGHDLRNPLGAITLSAQMLSRSDTLDDRQSRLASRIVSSAERMGRMVGELLDLTRTRLGVGLNFTPAPMDLGPLCELVLGELETVHSGRAVRFEATGDLRGSWDADRIAQMVSNLAGNALQHGDSKPVRVHARADGDHVIIAIHNDGRPIPADALGRIFEPFVRDPSHAEPRGSTSMGLGLYIAREVVTAHGGTIDVASTKAAGTTFTVRLPRSPPAGPLAHGQPRANASSIRAVH